MSELFTYGSVGRAPGNWCLYPEAIFPGFGGQTCRKWSLEPSELDFGHLGYAALSINTLSFDLALGFLNIR
jgi:hypothetical protein